MKKFPLIDLICLDLSTMEMFESIHELSNIFGCIGFHDSIAMGSVVFPLSYVFDSMFIVLIVDLNICEFIGVGGWDRFKAILG